jgi:hypothetical protein
MRSHGIGVCTRFVNMKTNSAPSSSPKLEPPTMICAQAELPRYRRATTGAMAFSR